VGSRSGARARAQASGTPAGQQQQRPPTVAGAALVQAMQAAAVLIAAVLAGIATSDGKSYQTGSGIAITVIGVVTGAGLACVAAGLVRASRWTRTPALLTQLFSGIVGIYLVQGQRYWWGVPLLVLSAAGFVLLLVPPSMRALAHEPPGTPAR
jgi:hypothetical protein